MKRLVMAVAMVALVGCKSAQEKERIGMQCGYRYEPGSNAFFECTRNNGLSSCDDVCQTGGAKGRNSRELERLTDDTMRLQRKLDEGSPSGVPSSSGWGTSR